MLWHVWPCWPRRDFPSQGWPIPRDSKGLTYKYAFHMQTNQSRAHTPTMAYSQNLTLRDAITQRPGTRKLGTAHTLQSLLKLFKLVNPKRAYPASTIPSRGNHNKGSCPCFPLPPSTSWPALMLPCVAPPWYGISPPLGNCEYKLSFQRQSSPDLLASPDLNKIKSTF